MQLVLGAVYAWSTFLPAIVKVTGAPRPVANATFSIVLAVLGITAGFGGFLNARFGPRLIATVAGLLYGIGTMLSGLVVSQLTLLFITYGLLGGIGLGLGYIVAVAMLIKWFPDRRGFITGLAVAGFGGGAAIVGPIAAALIGPPATLSVPVLTANLRKPRQDLGNKYVQYLLQKESGKKSASFPVIQAKTAVSVRKPVQGHRQVPSGSNENESWKIIAGLRLRRPCCVLTLRMRNHSTEPVGQRGSWGD